MRLKLLILFLSLFAASTVYATAQSPDRLIYEGQTYALHTNPLEKYFADNPDQHPRKAEDGDSVTLSSGLWGGYIATFEVIDKALVLTEFEVRRSSPNRDERSKLVSEIERFFSAPQSRQMEWYSGIMVLPTGEMKQYVHLSYASVFDSYTMLRVENGAVTDEAKISGEEFIRYKRKQFEVYRESPEYLRVLEELRDDSGDEFSLEQFVFDYGEFVEHVMLDFSEAKRPD